MKIPLPPLTIPAAVLVLLVALIWIGLRVAPAPFPPLSLAPGSVQTVPLPPHLPAPVERFYRVVYGDSIPSIHSVVITGRAKIRPFGAPTLQARFRFSHVAGRSYRHYIEATFLGLPVMKVNESYVGGHSRVQTPAGREEGEPKTEQAANLGMWAELSQVPAALLTDPRVRWEPLDDESAILVVPGDTTAPERFVVRFDPRTHLLTFMEVMRYQRKDSPRKTLWITDAVSWGRVSGFMTNRVGTAWWYGASRPWAMFRTEDLLINADLSAYIDATGR
jgi:hypothetical protein